ncbi:MAG: helix-turn-helix domain-containing protein [Bacteroidota bacterium]
MQQLKFDRKKWGKELLIDAYNQDELEFSSQELVMDFYSLLFVRKGQGTYYLDTEKINLDQHMVLFIRPGQVSNVDQIDLEKCQLLFFEGEFLDRFFNLQDFIFKFGCFHNPDRPSSIILIEEHFQFYYLIAKEIRWELHNQTADSEHILRSLIYYLLVRLNQTYAHEYGTANNVYTDSIIIQFLKLLDQSFKTEKTVEGCAQKLGISRVQLNHLCKKHFSKTANQMIRERLIAEIKKALKYESKSIAEIAYDFNFSAPSHFSRFVKQMTGLTPQECKIHLSNW